MFGVRQRHIFQSVNYLTFLIYRDDLVHGFILVYSTKRRASLATLVAFSQNIPNLPIQILAVTETGGAANAFFNSELSQQLITAGNAAADRLQVVNFNSKFCSTVSNRFILF